MFARLVGQSLYSWASFASIYRPSLLFVIQRIIKWLTILNQLILFLIVAIPRRRRVLHPLQPQVRSRLRLNDWHEHGLVTEVLGGEWMGLEPSYRKIY